MQILFLTTKKTKIYRNDTPNIEPSDIEERRRSEVKRKTKIFQNNLSNFKNYQLREKDYISNLPVLKQNDSFSR